MVNVKMKNDRPQSLHDVMYAYHMNHWAFPSNTGCLDEYYIFQSVVGVVRGVTDLQLLAFDQAFDQQKYAGRTYCSMIINDGSMI